MCTKKELIKFIRILRTFFFSFSLNDNNFNGIRTDIYLKKTMFTKFDRMCNHNRFDFILYFLFIKENKIPLSFIYYFLYIFRHIFF